MSDQTAALLLVLMHAVWLPAFFFRRVAWISLVACLLLGFGLLRAGSLDGILVAIGALPLLIIWAPRPWSRPLAVVSGLTVAAFAAGAFAWTGENISTDRQVPHRLELWKQVPRMMLDAPDGWGSGRGGSSYSQWYQPLNQPVAVFDSLGSSHATWLVERSWLIRFAWLFGWIMVLVLCRPARQRRWYAVPFSVWAAFGLSAFLGDSTGNFLSWTVPLLLLGAVLYHRYTTGKPLYERVWAMGALLTLFLLAGVAGIGAASGKALLRGTPNGCRIAGDGEPWVLVVPEAELVELPYGQAIRESGLAARVVYREGQVPAGSAYIILGRKVSVPGDLQNPGFQILIKNRNGRSLPDDLLERLERL